jgi:hypothetical protein
MSRWRRGEGPAGEERKAENRAADSESLLLPFAVTGQVTVWDPTHRTLEIGPRAFAVARNASVADLAAGVHVTVAGYMERPPDSVSRWIVTRLVLG